MNHERAAKAAKWLRAEELTRWNNIVTAFSSEVYPKVVAAQNTACTHCPFRNLLNVGGCLGEDCPVFQVRHAVKRAVPRAANAVKEIFKIKCK